KIELKDKLENETFSWDDMQNFIIFSTYVGENSPEIQNLITGWEQTVLFDIKNSSNDMWWFIGNNMFEVEIGTNPPQEYGILIELSSFQTLIEIVKQDETSLSAFQKGKLRYEGPFNEVLKVSQITAIVSATLMDTVYTPPQANEFNFQITVDQKDLYIEEGLTLFPCIEITINPDHIGEHHRSSVGLGSAIIIDHNGNIIAELEDTGHTVHEFINSTTIMMGGQEGYMELWNYKTNKLETLTVPGGHHEINYNPETDTFMVLEYVVGSEIYDGKNVMYDLLSEYNRAGDLVWQWDPRVYFPFNATRHASLGTNETFRGGADWMHSNSFTWDKINKTIYLNVRNLDTILKINYTTKEVIWDAGREGEFTLFNKAGEEVNTLFCHPHSLERLTSDRFIMYDNDLFNQSNPATMGLDNSSGYSRYLEIEIDEEEQIMREVWSYTPQNQTYYFPESGGDADRLPNGNTVGTFAGKALVLNVRDPVIITEVTKDGEIAWELQIPGANNTYYWVHRLERFYEKPVISIHNHSIDLEEGNLWLNFTTWNTFKQEIISTGKVSITADGEEIYQEIFEFLPQWQPNTLEITVNDLSANVKTVELIIENSDGIKSSIILYQKPSNSSFPLEILIILGSIMIAIPVITISSFVIVRKIKKSQNSVEPDQ
ncbi:MAG: aryl-sulfate sulfotransferase, partial [Candidatus Hodarchaeota archaeon]